MGIKHKKLKEWVAAGVISQEQATAIQTHEDNKKRGHFGRGLINVSIFAIIVGILSIIASNWHEISPSMKIGVHVVLNLIAGFVAYKADKAGKDVWREGATLALFGLTITLIILIGQIYQLTGALSDALLLWMVATLPLMVLMGRTYATSVPWLLAFLVTMFVALARYLPLMPETIQFYVGFGACCYMPLLLLLVGKSAPVQKFKPALANTASRLGIIWLALGASMSLIVWRIFSTLPSRDFHYEREQVFIVLLVGLAALGVHAVLNKFYKQDETRRYGALFVAVSFVLTLLPFLFVNIGGTVLCAAAFIAYWVFIGWLGQMLGRMRTVSLAIVLIAFRIIIVYIEVFKSLMETGFLLISAGIIILVMIYGARKLNERLTKGGKNVAI